MTSANMGENRTVVKMIAFTRDEKYVIASGGQRGGAPTAPAAAVPAGRKRCALMGACPFLSTIIPPRPAGSPDTALCGGTSRRAPEPASQTASTPHCSTALMLHPSIVAPRRGQSTCCPERSAGGEGRPGHRGRPQPCGRAQLQRAEGRSPRAQTIRLRQHAMRRCDRG